MDLPGRAHAAKTENQTLQPQFHVVGRTRFRSPKGLDEIKMIAKERNRSLDVLNVKIDLRSAKTRLPLIHLFSPIMLYRSLSRLSDGALDLISDRASPDPMALRFRQRQFPDNRVRHRPKCSTDGTALGR